MAVPPLSLPQCLVAVATALQGSAAELNRLDGYAGDGDLGVTMSGVAKVLEEVAAERGGTGAAELLSSCASEIARRAPSTSGTLTATAFLGASKALSSAAADKGAGEDAPGTEVLQLCFAAAMEGVQARGKASVGDRTVVDGLEAVCASLSKSVARGSAVTEALRDAAAAASRAAEATAAMVPKIGRASWVAERAIGNPDAGCTALAIALGAVAALATGT